MLCRGGSVLYVLVYMDDLVIDGNNSALISSSKTYLSRTFRMKDLGIEVSRSNDIMYLSQRKYTLDMISKF